MTKFSLLFLIEFTTTISICTGGLEIAALLQAFGFSVGLCGLANVLQCGWGFLFQIAHQGKRGKGKKQNKFLQVALTYQRALNLSNRLFFIHSCNCLSSCTVFLRLVANLFIAQVKPDYVFQNWLYSSGFYPF